MLQLNFKAKRENYKQNLPRVRLATINSVLHVRAPAHVHTQRELRDLPCDTGYNGGEQTYWTPTLQHISATRIRED